MLKCDPCPSGTFADTTGATACKPCKNCLLNNSAICPYANNSLCRNAYEQLCQRDSDAKCIKCPVEEKGWDMDPVWGVCKLKQCLRGWYYDRNIPNEWDRCTKCGANFYCPESTQPFVECEVLTEKPWLFHCIDSQPFVECRLYLIYYTFPKSDHQ